MENWWRYCLSCFILLSLSSCDRLSNETYHKLSEHEKRQLASNYLGLANRLESGTPKNMRLLEKASRIFPRNELVWRELAYPYLTRGFYKEWNAYYEKAIELNPKAWQAWRGHSKLYYFRDYGGALFDFDATDTLTVDKTDYVRVTSVDYLRGLCYYGLKNYNKSKEYFDLYLEEENAKTGTKEIDASAHLYLGSMENYYQNYDSAIKILTEGIELNGELADLYYQKAYAHFMSGKIEEASDNIQLAKDLFSEDKNHRNRYYEVIDQLYERNLVELEKEIACFQ